MIASLRIRLALALMVALLASGSAASANELQSSVRGLGVVIHDADETMANFCHWTDGKLMFDMPGGASWELVTDIDDPAILNHGDGRFHPFDANEVRSALAGVRYPLERVSAQVFILPYPRRAGLESAAGAGVILLSPGVRPLAVETQHAEFTHELGHVVQYALMPDADTTAWGRYRRVRGIVDASTFSSSSMHVNRPHEIFAEDFRALFGDAQANYSGTIENSQIAYPTSVTGLENVMLNLADAPTLASGIVVTSASHGQVALARNGSTAADLDVFDVAGRRVAQLIGVRDAAGCHWNWDGRDASGSRIGATVLFARARDGRGGVARIVLLP